MFVIKQILLLTKKLRNDTKSHVNGIFFAIFASLFLLVVPNLRSNEEIPMVLPEGFAWKQLPFIQAYVLCPKGWFFHHKDVPKEKRYFFVMARENSDSGEKVHTAFNIIAIQDIPGKKNMKPSLYAINTIRSIKEKTTLEKEWNCEKGRFIERGFIRDGKDTQNGEPIREHYISLSNDITGTIYIISFVTLRERWEKDWPIAETIIKNINLDENI